MAEHEGEDEHPPMTPNPKSSVRTNDARGLDTFRADAIWGPDRWVKHDCTVNGITTLNVTHSKHFHRNARGQLVAHSDRQVPSDG